MRGLPWSRKSIKSNLIQACIRCFIGVGIIIIIFLLWEIQGHRKPCLVLELIDVWRVTDVGTAPDANLILKDICSITAGKRSKRVPIALSKLPILVMSRFISVPTWMLEPCTSASFVLTWRNFEAAFESIFVGSMAQQNNSILIPRFLCNLLDGKLSFYLFTECHVVCRF